MEIVENGFEQPGVALQRRLVELCAGRRRRGRQQLQIGQDIFVAQCQRFLPRLFGKRGGGGAIGDNRAAAVFRLWRNLGTGRRGFTATVGGGEFGQRRCLELRHPQCQTKRPRPQYKPAKAKQGCRDIARNHRAGSAGDERERRAQNRFAAQADNPAQSCRKTRNSSRTQQRQRDPHEGNRDQRHDAAPLPARNARAPPQQPGQHDWERQHQRNRRSHRAEQQIR